jgi:hypothetical protein
MLGGQSAEASSEATIRYPRRANMSNTERGCPRRSGELPGRGHMPSRMSGTALVVES